MITKGEYVGTYFPSWAEKRSEKWGYMGWISRGDNLESLCRTYMGRSGIRSIDIYPDGAVCWLKRETREERLIREILEVIPEKYDNLRSEVRSVNPTKITEILIVFDNNIGFPTADWELSIAKLYYEYKNE